MVVDELRNDPADFLHARWGRQLSDIAFAADFPHGRERVKEPDLGLDETHQTAFGEKSRKPLLVIVDVLAQALPGLGAHRLASGLSFWPP